MKFPQIGLRNRPPSAAQQPAPKVTLRSTVDALLATPEFQARIHRFLREGRAFDLKEAPRVLDQLLDLNCLELHTLLEAFGFSHRALRRQHRLRWGPATAAQVMQILFDAKGNERVVPTTPREADALLSASRAEMAKTSDPVRRASLEQQRSELGKVRQQLMKVPRRRGLDHFAFYGQFAVSARLLPFEGESSPDPQKQQKIDRNRAQGGLLPIAGGTKGSRFLSDYMESGVGVGPALFIGEKNRKTRRREWEPSLNAPTFSSTHGGAYYAFRPGGRRVRGHLGYHLAGPKNLSFPLPMFSDDPIVGKSIRVKYQFKFSVFIGERYLGYGWYPERYAQGLRIPGTQAKALPHFGVGIQSDFIYYLTGPLLELTARLAENMLEPFGQRNSDTPLTQPSALAVRPVRAADAASKAKPMESSAANENSAPYPNRSASIPEAQAPGDLPSTSIVASTV